MVHPSARSPQLTYRDFGDTRPPKNTLIRLSDVLSDRAEPEDLLTLADMQIDLGVKDAPNLATHFDNAWENLNLVVGMTDDLIADNSGSDLSVMASQAVQARLRMAELSTWRKAASGEPTKIDYPTYLGAAAQAMRFVGFSIRAHSSMTEFMPVLLGARGTYLGRNLAWTGRLALTREDQRLSVREYYNPNWDCSVSLDPQPKTFITPKRDNRLQIKLAPKGEKDPGYDAAGITVISSIAGEFHKPEQIVAECVEELERIQCNSKGKNCPRLSIQATQLIFMKSGLEQKRINE